MMRVYNTASRRVEDFKPIEKGQVGLYTCGPTVYDYAQIGNLRAFVFDDTLRRVLNVAGFDVKHVMNITDVGHLASDEDEGEDKLEKGASRENKSVWEVAEFYIGQSH
jgi:cysteinyl-tRNA synthetase